MTILTKRLWVGEDNMDFVRVVSFVIATAVDRSTKDVCLTRHGPYCSTYCTARVHAERNSLCSGNKDTSASCISHVLASSSLSLLPPPIGSVED